MTSPKTKKTSPHGWKLKIDRQIYLVTVADAEAAVNFARRNLAVTAGTEIEVVVAIAPEEFEGLKLKLGEAKAYGRPLPFGYPSKT